MLAYYDSFFIGTRFRPHHQDVFTRQGCPNQHVIKPSLVYYASQPPAAQELRLGLIRTGSVSFQTAGLNEARIYGIVCQITSYVEGCGFNDHLYVPRITGTSLILLFT